jgi:hypothetical protein
MPAGRPIEYSEEIIRKAQNYLDFLPVDEVIHSIEGLSTALNIARSTIYEWIKHEDKTVFSDIVSQILAKQGKTLVNKGLKGEFNSKITGMMMSKHGYAEATDITSGGKELKAITGMVIAKDE